MEKIEPSPYLLTLYYSASTQAISGGNFSIGSNVYYYHNDHLGTPMMMTDINGNVVWQGEFKPFGELLSITGSITNNLRFPGQYYDEETGLHYNYFRDYKSEICGSGTILQHMITVNSGCSKTRLRWRVPSFRPSCFWKILLLPAP